ncbi:NAD(P)-binding protein [Amylostereum chailletii]|nr:NAD(P)-binding protein [Amylostereum chailletii]
MSSTLSMISQTWPPKPKWGTDDIPDLKGKVTIVTGAYALSCLAEPVLKWGLGNEGGYSGVGKETVKALLAHNAKVYIAARSEEKAKVAIEDLKKETGKEAIFLKLDLADLPQVRKSAEEFLGKEKELHILFNNAGVMSCPIDLLTAQNYDMQCGTNVIGHHFFTKLLLPALSAAFEASGQKPRVVTTSSSGSTMPSKAKVELWTDVPQRKKRASFDMYCQSKFGNVVQAKELARRYGDKLVSTSVNPGNLKSELQRHMEGTLQAKLVECALLYPASLGALTQLWAGTSPEGAEFNGKYLVPWARVGKANPATQDPEEGEKLWEWLEEQCARY